LVKRIRKVKTLAYIIGHLKSQMPALVGKEKKQKKLINDLPTGKCGAGLFCQSSSFVDHLLGEHVFTHAACFHPSARSRAQSFVPF
jgi:ABC-type uncharacterized transport system YnjBCD ATPase subunit